MPRTVKLVQDSCYMKYFNLIDILEMFDNDACLSIDRFIAIPFPGVSSDGKTRNLDLGMTRRVFYHGATTPELIS